MPLSYFCFSYIKTSTLWKTVQANLTAIVLNNQMAEALLRNTKKKDQKNLDVRGSINTSRKSDSDYFIVQKLQI